MTDQQQREEARRRSDHGQPRVPAGTVAVLAARRGRRSMTTQTTKEQSVIDNETEARLDELYQQWQRWWTNATGNAAEDEAAAGLEALQAAYKILGLETP